jgi:hypothetical protein
MAGLFDGDPKTGKGFAGWVALGSLAALMALLVGSLAPSILPARATQTKL